VRAFINEGEIAKEKVGANVSNQAAVMPFISKGKGTKKRTRSGNVGSVEQLLVKLVRLCPPFIYVSSLHAH
jgi:hypothetical protein